MVAYPTAPACAPACADKLMNHAIETVMMAVGNGAAPTSRSWSVKVVFVAWAIFCVIMLSAYTANLTANITVNQIGLSVTSLQDLAKMSQPFGVPADSSVSAYFSSSTDRGALALRHKMVGTTAARRKRSVSLQDADTPSTAPKHCSVCAWLLVLLRACLVCAVETARQHAMLRCTCCCFTACVGGV